VLEFPRTLVLLQQNLKIPIDKRRIKRLAEQSKFCLVKNVNALRTTTIIINAKTAAKITINIFEKYETTNLLYDRRNLGTVMAATKPFNQINRYVKELPSRNETTFLCTIAIIDSYPRGKHNAQLSSLLYFNFYAFLPSLVFDVNT